MAIPSHCLLVLLSPNVQAEHDAACDDACCRYQAHQHYRRAYAHERKRIGIHIRVRDEHRSDPDQHDAETEKGIEHDSDDGEDRHDGQEREYQHRDIDLLHPLLIGLGLGFAFVAAEPSVACFSAILALHDGETSSPFKKRM